LDKTVVRRAILSLGVLLLVGVVGWLWFIHEFRINVSRSDLEPLEMAIKKAASDVVVVKRPTSVPVRASSGYLVAYQRDPETFGKDAKLFDAWAASMKMGFAALKSTSRGNWVRSSVSADYVESQDRVDPWKHTFCLLRRDDNLLVISGGPKAPSSPTCRDIQFQAKDLAELPHGKLLESPAGYLILVVDETHADRVSP
jgi:hypothetical protein